MNRHLRRFLGWAIYIFFRLRIYQTWSRIYRFFFEKKKTPVRRFDNLDVLVKYVSLLKWKPDGLRELWDAMGSAESVQYLADNDPERLIGDCDEFAVYQAHVINRELADDPEWGSCNLFGAAVMNVVWYTPGVGLSGHNVSLLSYRDGAWAFMDYGWPSKPRTDIEAVAMDVLKSRSPFIGSILVGVTVLGSSSLKLGFQSKSFL